MPDLFSPFTLKGVTLRNRIAKSPMTQHRSPKANLGRQAQGRLTSY